MFKWIKKKIIKSLINDVKKDLSKHKDRIEEYWKANKDEIISEILEKIKELIKSKVGF
jgi:hypothetical protein